MIESANNSLKRGLVRRESFPDTEHLRQRVNERARTNNVCLSCSRTGNCHDNTMAESFFATLKNEMHYRRRQYSAISHQIPANAMESLFERTKPESEPLSMVA